MEEKSKNFAASKVTQTATTSPYLELIPSSLPRDALDHFRTTFSKKNHALDRTLHFGQAVLRLRHCECSACGFCVLWTRTLPGQLNLQNKTPFRTRLSDSALGQVQIDQDRTSANKQASGWCPCVEGLFTCQDRTARIPQSSGNACKMNIQPQHTTPPLGKNYMLPLTLRSPPGQRRGMQAQLRDGEPEG